MKTNNKALPLGSMGSHARQGDVLLRRIEKIPGNLTPVKPTLALGEVTGHHHSFVEGGVTAFADAEDSLANFVSVTEPEAPLVHQEHEKIAFPAGEWESLKQVEDTVDEVHQVSD